MFKQLSKKGKDITHVQESNLTETVALISTPWILLVVERVDHRLLFSDVK